MIARRYRALSKIIHIFHQHDGVRADARGPSSASSSKK
jgi:hypothetical protein